MANTITWNAESVAVAWLRSLGLNAATNIPDRVKWDQDTFCLVSAVPSRRPDIYDTSRTPTVSVDVFADPGAWGPVFSTAEKVRDETRVFSSMKLTHAKTPQYVVLTDVSPLSTPTPVRLNEGDRARVTFLIELTYFPG